MLLFTALNLLVISSVASSSSSHSCSALQAFVEVKTSSTVSSLKNDTLISTQALFPPHTYNIPWTALVVLSPDDNICSSSSKFSSDITDKMVLLFESIGDCSVHSKVFTAEVNGAKAVLMANNDLTGQVINIVDDNLYGYDTTIPMRGISKNDGELLYDEVESNHGVEVRFGCPDAGYPSVVCLTDPTGSFADFSGNYQQQADEAMNGHPVWKLNGYANVRSDIYLYLYDANGASDLYWIASYDKKFGKEFDIGLKCDVGGSSVPDPTFCPLWIGTNDHGKSFSNIPLINVTDNLCPVGGETLCVDSLRHELAGLRGEYTLHSNGEPIWYRELTDCDMRAGYLSYIADGEYGTGYFALDEPLNKWVIATCVLPTEWSENGTFATAKWKPEICTDWFARDDIGLRYTPLGRYSDPTLSITIGKCPTAHTHTPQCVASTVPSTLCLANNSIVHGALMGEYILLNETGPYFGSPIYQRIHYDNPIITNDTDTLYIWYANEFFAHFGYGDYLHRREWMITFDSLDKAMADGRFSYFGLCQGYAFGNVAKCAGWVFYAGAFHYDEEMTVTEGECKIEPFPSLPDVWPQYIAVGLKNKSLEYADQLSTLEVSQIIGVYVLNDSLPSDSDVVPAWQKYTNDLVQDNMYIWFSDEWGLSNDTTIKMLCDPYNNANILDPVECKVWYDMDWERLDNIYLYESDANGVPVVRTTEAITICLSNGTIHSLLEGIYQDTLVHRDEYGSIEFISQNEYLDDTLYLWYYDSKWWLSPFDYDSKLESDVYGYCEGGKRGELPFCSSCWRFYWALSPLHSNSESKYIEDCSFKISSICQQNDVYDGEMDYLDSLCVNKVIDDVGVHLNAILGKYDLKKNSYYKQGLNPMYLWHNKVMNEWFIGRTLFGESDALLMCYDLRECLMWNEDVDNMVSITEQCIEYKEDKTFGDKARLGIGIGIVVIVIVICGAFIVLFWLKNKREKVHQSVNNIVETEFVGTRTDDVGGYNMSTLNDEEVQPVKT